ncbi:hypothetical protein CONLIGDRAFT_142070 [Coniochaeta ligniaria NRRL 30616]|uniref:Uncharacterized protein n=1 Tax=Coniochaeta ligniaria NRRL 30616 TaxID=1408157 RepID=A0A1J7I6L4_9PEZI|nr:hypothetical protein CONLIGDRAFT_142070 [Coniochaeta ligniaria NRRL 30616]
MTQTPPADAEVLLPRPGRCSQCTPSNSKHPARGLFSLSGHLCAGQTVMGRRHVLENACWWHKLDETRLDARGRCVHPSPSVGRCSKAELTVDSHRQRWNIYHGDEAVLTPSSRRLETAEPGRDPQHYSPLPPKTVGAEAASCNPPCPAITEIIRL